VLRAEDLTLVEVPVAAAPLNALSEIGPAVGKITKIPLVAGEMVLEHHLADPTQTIRDDE
jgi:flagella basal body P-ring formation protein FlgA